MRQLKVEAYTQAKADAVNLRLYQAEDVVVRGLDGEEIVQIEVQEDVRVEGHLRAHARA